MQQSSRPEPFVSHTETVRLIDVWYSTSEQCDMYELERQRDRKICAIRESSLRGFNGVTPQGLKYRLLAGECVAVEITTRRTLPYRWRTERR
jgi:hypothetical protein